MAGIAQAAVPNVDMESGGYRSALTGGINIGKAIDDYKEAKRYGQKFQEEKARWEQEFNLLKTKATSAEELAQLEIQGRRSYNAIVEQYLNPSVGMMASSHQAVMGANGLQENQQGYSKATELLEAGARGETPPEVSQYYGQHAQGQPPTIGQAAAGAGTFDARNFDASGSRITKAAVQEPPATQPSPTQPGTLNGPLGPMQAELKGGRGGSINLKPAKPPVSPKTKFQLQAMANDPLTPQHLRDQYKAQLDGIALDETMSKIAEARAEIAAGVKDDPVSRRNEADARNRLKAYKESLKATTGELERQVDNADAEEEKAVAAMRDAKKAIVMHDANDPNKPGYALHGPKFNAEKYSDILVPDQNGQYGGYKYNPRKGGFDYFETDRDKELKAKMDADWRKYQGELALWGKQYSAAQQVIKDYPDRLQQIQLKRKSLEDRIDAYTRALEDSKGLEDAPADGARPKSKSNADPLGIL